MSWRQPINKMTGDQKPVMSSRVRPSCHCRWYWSRCTVKATDCRWLISMTVQGHNRGLLEPAFWWRTPVRAAPCMCMYFLHRKVGVNSGRSDQLALAESGLLTLDPCWVVLSINPLGLSWSWCSVLSSGAAKHTAAFTLQLPLSVSLSRSCVPRVSARFSWWPLKSWAALNLPVSSYTL